MSDSTKRALRTLVQGLVALVTVVPAVLAMLPEGTPLAAQLASVAVGAAVVSKVLNVLEDNGLLPAWLKVPPSASG